MKRKRKWWLWLTIAFVCMIVVFAVSELTGASIGSVFGWGILGILGLLAAASGLALAALFLIAPAAAIIRLLVRGLTSNREVRYITLGSLGFCAILVGWILTIRQVGWSFVVIMVGFALGCLTGVEYQEHSLSSSNQSARSLEQVPDEEDEEDI